MSSDGRAGRRRRPSLWASTLRALAKPRRAIPIGAVASAMVAAEAYYTRAPLAVLADVLLGASVVLIAPAAWRWLHPGPGEARREVVTGALAYLVVCAFLVALFGGALPLMLLGRWTYVTEPPSLGVVLILVVVGGWGLGRDIELERGLRAERRRAEALSREAENAQLLALRAHLDPHFLFNTLNAIAEWCREDPLVAEAATLKLATVLRAILSGVREERWPLDRELELLELLFELYRVRDPGRFQLELIRPEAGASEGVTLPPMLLLPLVENAIKHGPAAGHKGRVVVTSAPSPGALIITVENPGGYSGPREGGEGLPTVERRLALAYGGRAALTIEDHQGSTVATVTLPTGETEQKEAQR